MRRKRCVARVLPACRASVFGGLRGRVDVAAGGRRRPIVTTDHHQHGFDHVVYASAGIAALAIKTELQALIEYGFTDRFTGIFIPELQHVDIAAPTSAQRTGLGYTEFGGRYQALQGDAWVLSGQATLRVPGTNETSNPAAIGYTGIETDVRALFGYTFAVGNWPAFIDLQLAQRFRAGAPPDELRFDATFGVRPAPRWLEARRSCSTWSPEGAGGPLFGSYGYVPVPAAGVYEPQRAGLVAPAAGRPVHDLAGGQQRCAGERPDPRRVVLGSEARLLARSGPRQRAAQTHINTFFAGLCRTVKSVAVRLAGVVVGEPAPHEGVADRRPVERGEPIGQHLGPCRPSGAATCSSALSQGFPARRALNGSISPTSGPRLCG